MTSYYKDNIVAMATASANGAVGIIRISGPDVKQILFQIFKQASGKSFENFAPRHLYFGKICDENGLVLDQGMAVYMPAPNSFTGEDVVELHGHGNLILMKNIIQGILNLKETLQVRAAEPGEFSKRAFLNGKLDLTQAESIHELVTAESEATLKSSLSNLDGRIKFIIEDLCDRLRISLALVEASFEFPEEDIQTYDKNQLLDLLNYAILNLSQLKSAFLTSKLYDNGVSVALVGEPNVGKSSLLNSILVEERAIVTDVAGTTRDVVEGSKILSGIRYIFRDTAGLRETSDAVETVGIQRSQLWLDKSDIVLYIFDDVKQVQPLLKIKKPHWFYVLNKADLIFPNQRLSDVQNDIENVSRKHGFDCVVSARLNFGIDRLSSFIEAFIRNQYSVQNSVQISVHVNQRQHGKISASLDHLINIKDLYAKSQLTEEELAEELRETIHILQEITGSITNEQILGEIFKRFCIGK